VTEPAYYHGGVRGLRCGDRLLPPDVTGAASLYDLDTAPAALLAEAQRVYRRDRVYLTTSRTAAGLYAALHREGGRTYGGSLYLVEPEGEQEPDLDYYGADGGSIAVPSARIIRVLERKTRRASLKQAAHDALLAVLADDENLGVESIAEIAGHGPKYVHAALTGWAGVALHTLGADGARNYRPAIFDEQDQPVDIDNPAVPSSARAALRVLAAVGNDDHDTTAAIVKAAWDEGPRELSLLMLAVLRMTADTIRHDEAGQQ
jgi:hypothetical protein